ncbi:SEC-C metal-binding domain-containing protein [Cellulosilyticum sp. I15G10I2]|uniref:SEC-C metal-binding domain-containing protein n=1 Tax=Cellulosilyticum sp. I15G10I2 TaxID=1892843 RepID=UPI00085C4A4A|nr:SEC-C metal-binding domain-containing protein [Cellulosilyticum sp. I15G10I2]
MSLYEQWNNYGEDAKERSVEEYKKVVENYLARERDVYDYLLSHLEEVVEGSISELGERFNMNDVEFLGFVDGINSSLKNGEYNLEELDGSSIVKLEFDLEKLYWNMLDAKAEWLYNLPQWEELLPAEQRMNIKKEYNKTKTVVKDKKVGRNDACPCGSGKKYKQCCMK